MSLWQVDSFFKFCYRFNRVICWCLASCFLSISFYVTTILITTMAITIVIVVSVHLLSLKRVFSLLNFVNLCHHFCSKLLFCEFYLKAWYYSIRVKLDQVNNANSGFVLLSNYCYCRSCQLQKVGGQGKGNQYCQCGPSSPGGQVVQVVRLVLVVNVVQEARVFQLDQVIKVITKGLCWKVWIRMKILNHNIRLCHDIKICRNLRTFWEALGNKKCFFWSKTVFLGKE